MEGSEELREALVTMRRDVDLLRTEATHANLLLKALDAVLSVDGSEDPFARVFEALMPVFNYALAIVLIEDAPAAGALSCVAASNEMLVGSSWMPNRIFQKVLDGRVVASVAESGLQWWPPCANGLLEGALPALYMPLGVRHERGLLMLLRVAGQEGFDRNHATLAKKFSLLASHAFAAKQARQTAEESHRLKVLTDRLRASEEELRYRANHDPLTGLPNRSHVQEITNRLITDGQANHKIALAFIDLDNFKSVNDLHGHSVGDGLLKSAAARIKSQVRATDIVGRISGDEFVVIFNPLNRQAEISALAQRIRDCLRQTTTIEGIEISGSGTIGVALFPTHGKDYDMLKRHADTAMYRAKLLNKGTVMFFSRELGRQVSRRLRLERQMRLAIGTRSFKCALQQKVDISTGRVVGFEVLARWVDSRKAIHAPGIFLGTVKELGLLNEMTIQLISELVAGMPALEAQYGPALEYSINVTPGQCADAPFMMNVIDQLAATGKPGAFILEITEETFATYRDFETEVLPLIRRHGIRLSIDDFGTGYSSLAKLTDLTVDELKVDRSLISSIHERKRSQSVLRAIESLAAALGISLVAEGVETEAERNYLLAETGIRTVQGFLFHKPRLLSDYLG